MHPIRRAAALAAALLALAACSKPSQDPVAPVPVKLAALLTSPTHCLLGEGTLAPVELLALDLTGDSQTATVKLGGLPAPVPVAKVGACKDNRFEYECLGSEYVPYDGRSPLLSRSDGRVRHVAGFRLGRRTFDVVEDPDGTVVVAPDPDKVACAGEAPPARSDTQRTLGVVLPSRVRPNVRYCGPSGPVGPVHGVDLVGATVTAESAGKPVTIPAAGFRQCDDDEKTVSNARLWAGTQWVPLQDGTRVTIVLELAIRLPEPTALTVVRSGSTVGILDGDLHD